MLSIQNLSVYFGERVLYKNTSLHVKPKDKIGLIGSNGSGKSTLLRLISGQSQADEGEISKMNDCTIGFLNQDLLSYDSQNTILQVAMTGFGRQLHLQRQIDDLLQKIQTQANDKLIERLSQLQEKFALLDGYTIQSKAEEILEGLGFATTDLQAPLATFSGGWRMRVMLAKLLLQKPSLLMLDEPTNHLDLPSIQWLEHYLGSYQGAVIVVSHDRTFLDNVCKKIIEVYGGRLNSYSGNYTFYLKEKKLRDELQRNAFKNQQQKIKQTEQFINRFRAKATKARQVQSKVKILDKMEIVEDIENPQATISLHFPVERKPGKVIADMQNVSKSYGNNIIFQNTHSTINRGDKIAFIGANGKGKSTLLRMIAGTESFEGTRNMGYHVNMSFYAQHQLESLNVDSDMLEELKKSGFNKTELELRRVLGCFLFTQDDVFKKIKILSGGERSRLALAKTLISQANFLLLDEPTNHLDINSVNILVDALKQYEGSYIIVSHDRHFVKQVANKIWYIQNHAIKQYPGTYDEYVYWREKNEQQKSTSVNVLKKQKKAVEKTTMLLEEKTHKRQLKKMKENLSQIEHEIIDLEQKKTVMEEELIKPTIYTNPDTLAATTQKYEIIKNRLSQLNEEWEKATESLEEIQVRSN